MKASKNFQLPSTSSAKPNSGVSGLPLSLPRATNLSVKYNGLSAHKTMEARRMEVRAEQMVSPPAAPHLVTEKKQEDPKQVKPSPLNPLQVSSKLLVEKKGDKTNAEKVSSESNVNDQQAPVKLSSKSSQKPMDLKLNLRNQHLPAKPEDGDKKLEGEPTKAEVNDDGGSGDESCKQEEKVDGQPHKSKQKLTPEEMAEMFEAGLKKCQTKCDLLLTVQPRDIELDGQPFTHDFRQCVLSLAKSYFYFEIGSVPYSDIRRYRSECGILLGQEKVLQVLLDVLVDALQRDDCFDENGKLVKEVWLPFKNIVMILLNYSDAVAQLKFGITQHSEALPHLYKMLQSYRSAHMEKKLKTEQEKLLQFSLGIVHNCGSQAENVPRLRELNFIPLLLDYLESPKAAIRLASIATLADLVNESEAELLGTHPHIFSFLLDKLGRALCMVNRRDIGWSVEELVRAVRQLTRNDANKATLVQEGCLPLLLKTIKTGSDDELHEALPCLWNLSFDADVKLKILAEPGLVDMVRDKYHSLNGRLKHACHGILWSLRDVMLQQDQFKDIAEEILALRSETTPKEEAKSAVVEDSSSMSPSKGISAKGHVMISYQWGNQEVIKRISSELRSHGIPIWLDIDYMGGSTLQAMAQAVEESFAVIIAMSQKYKDSPNTRAEAEYTFQQRKPIIPLIMQANYRPDGWLGFILGSKLYYDFSGKYSFESRMEGLIKAVFTVAQRGTENADGSGPADQPLIATTAGALALTSPTVLAPAPSAGSGVQVKQRCPMQAVDLERVRAWTEQEVNDWLMRHKLEGCPRLTELAGEEIVFMHNLRFEAPAFFYKCLEKKLQLGSILDLAKATKAFESLLSK